MEKKTVAIIQARMGSTRLPGKVMLDLCGKTVLEHVIERVKRVKNIDQIVIATTELERDDLIVKEAEKCWVGYYRGSEDDVLRRYYYAAKENQAEIVVRITSDCPLIDPNITNEIIEFYKTHDYDLVTNAGIDEKERTYPRGLDTEVFSFEILEEAFLKADQPYQREHVTPYIYENCKNIYYYKNDVDYSQYRWTLDTEEDYKLIETIYKYLYPQNTDFAFDDILKIIKKYPHLAKINAHVEQKKVKE
ncbi:MAG TPA: NTP transferase domain-containing protein [Clostridia bacterium]|nr:NTP transferase domain-containing protein [Clostridia bacterium]